MEKTIKFSVSVKKSQEDENGRNSDWKTERRKLFFFQYFQYSRNYKL